MRNLGVLRLVLFLISLLFTLSCNHSKKRIQSVKQDIPFTKEGTLQIKKAKTDDIIITLDIEIADDDYQTQTGLMYRNNIKNSQGMLFVFPDESERSFYMKSTRMPLDIIYISKDSIIVSIQKNTKPFNETALPSLKPAKYVLEVNAGLSDSWKLENGDRILFNRIK